MVKIVEKALVIYTDGSCYQNGKGRKGGFGVLFLHFDETGNETVIDDYMAPSVKGTTNQRMELEAAVTALQMAPKMECYHQVNGIVVRTDSRYVADHYFSALTNWRNNGWCNHHGKPVDNADLWKRFVRAHGTIRKRIEFEWVKGHGKGRAKDPHNEVADKLAKASRDNPLTRKQYRSSVRRKLSDRPTKIGSIGVHGQQIKIRVTETLPLRVQKTWKYRCEVISTDSPYHQNVDWLYSNAQLRDGHSYEVVLNDQPKNPQIVTIVCEIEPPKTE